METPPDRRTVLASLLSVLAATATVGAVAALVAALHRAEEAAGRALAGEVIPIAAVGFGAVGAGLGAWYAARQSNVHPIRSVLLLAISILLSFDGLRHG